MKKIVLLICVIILYSCTNNEKTNTNNTFNPPLWIQGTWSVITYSNPQPVFRFTTDDFILITLNIERSQKDQIEQSKKSLGVNVIITEEVTNSIYNITIKTTSLSGSISTIYKFKKVDATHISTDFTGLTTVLDKL